MQEQGWNRRPQPERRGMGGEREIQGHGFNREPRLSPPDSKSGPLEPSSHWRLKSGSIIYTSPSLSHKMESVTAHTSRRCEDDINIM